MSRFMSADFLLGSSPARQLYHEYAAAMPIYDYHCHLSPKDIADDRRFDNLGQIWLEGDHYKWRAMRAAGVPEALITGKGVDDYERYLAWANTVPSTLGNPLFHWTHLELRRPFGLEGVVFGPDTAREVWQHCNALLAGPAFSARGLMRQMQVKMVGTTDDPIDSLEHHVRIARDPEMEIEVAPTWRPDRAFKIELPGFADYLLALGAAARVEIDSFASLQEALLARLDHFAKHGCRAADHGIEVVRYADYPGEAQLDRILARRLAGEHLGEDEVAAFTTALQVWLGRQYARLGWVMQLHMGAQRNNNSRQFSALGPDAGFDSIGDRPYARELAQLLDAMEQSDELPKTILYCLNPRDNEMIATMIGNFQGGGVAGKIQFGSGWWFNDQKDGMQRQLEQLSQLGLLSQFVGMLTDSRSFLSFTRHEYFRRILCAMIGRWVEAGEVPDDLPRLGAMVQDICYHNARRYFARAGESLA